jgi:hypothetical protein
MFNPLLVTTLTIILGQVPFLSEEYHQGLTKGWHYERTTRGGALQSIYVCLFDDVVISGQTSRESCVLSILQ